LLGGFAIKTKVKAAAKSIPIADIFYQLKQFKIKNSEFKMGKVFDSKVKSIWIHAI